MSRAPAPKSFKHKSQIQLIIDVMAGSVIPLFHAFEKNKKLFSTFLRTHPNKAFIKEYLKVCQDLYGILRDRKKHIVEQIQHFESALDASQNLKKEWLETRKRYKNPYYFYHEKTDLITEANETIIEQNVLIEKYSCKIEKLNILLQNFTMQSVDELETFLDQIELYCTVPDEGYEQLKIYFDTRQDILDFFDTHQTMFHMIANDWIQFVMQTNRFSIHHSLPVYLCPLNAKLLICKYKRPQ